LNRHSNSLIFWKANYLYLSLGGLGWQATTIYHIFLIVCLRIMEQVFSGQIKNWN